RRRLQLINVQPVAQDREVTVLLRKALGQPLPGVAAVIAAPDSGCAVRTGARHPGQRYHVDRVGIVRVDHDREAEVRRQTLGDGAPGAAGVVGARHADVGAPAAGAVPFTPAAVVLHVEPAWRVGMAGDLVNALAEFGIRVGREAGPHAVVGSLERLAAILAE